MYSNVSLFSNLALRASSVRHERHRRRPARSEHSNAGPGRLTILKNNNRTQPFSSSAALRCTSRLQTTFTTMETCPAQRSRKIVLDTAAFISGTESLYALGGLIDPESDTAVVPPEADEQVTFYSTPDVVQEVRDARARARLSLLQGALILRVPSAEALAAVTEFARATGDYSSLSLTDLRVMALCWMLEVERDGGASLNKKPEFVSPAQIRIGHTIPFAEVERMEREQEEKEEAQRQLNDGWVTVQKKQPKPLPVPKRKRKSKKGKKSAPSEGSPDLSAPPIAGSEGIELQSSTSTQVSQTSITSGAVAQDTKPMNMKEVETDETSTTLPEETVKDAVDELGRLTIDKNETLHTDHAQANLSTQATPAMPDLPKEDENKPVAENERDADDDGVGWINEENLEEHLSRNLCAQESSLEELERVGCVTTDYAMQNTMLQMGLKILTTDGRGTIRKINRFALRCHSCGVVTRELERKFCEQCGNAAFHRVAFRVNTAGVARAFINPKRQPRLRGTKYPIPMPRGGRHNTDLVLREDQVDPVRQRRIQKQLDKKNVDVLDPTTFYNAGVKFNPHDQALVIGYGGRNPNEVKRSIRRKR